MRRGAQLFIATCNPQTVCDQTVGVLRQRGATIIAHRGMGDDQLVAAIDQSLAWQPTHLLEMGADLTIRAISVGAPPSVRCSLECTGSGIQRLSGRQLPYPVFDVDKLPLKVGIHNRHMVGATAWYTFYETTRLTLYEKRVAVIGYGMVGRGVAEAARYHGARVVVVERDPARALEATYDRWDTASLAEALPSADVVVTATGKRHVLAREHFALLRDGCFLFNVGHGNDEIDIDALLRFEHDQMLPHIQRVQLGGKKIYLLAGGAMFNLAAGFGDSINAFDVAVATLLDAMRRALDACEGLPPGLHAVP